MKTKKIHFPIVPPTKTSGKIQVPPHLPAMHGIHIWVGRRNAGKSVAATNLIKRYLDIGVVERVILVSPTFESNMHTFAPLRLDPTQDVIEPTKDAVSKVKAKLDEEYRSTPRPRAPYMAHYELAQLMNPENPRGSLEAFSTQVSPRFPRLELKEALQVAPQQ